MITLPEIIAVDLPTIIIVIVVWLINFFKITEIENRIKEVKERLGPR